MGERGGFVIIDTPPRPVSERTTENLRQLVAIFDKHGRDRLPGPVWRHEVEAELARRDGQGASDE